MICPKCKKITEELTCPSCGSVSSEKEKLTFIPLQKKPVPISSVKPKTPAEEEQEILFTRTLPIMPKKDKAKETEDHELFTRTLPISLKKETSSAPTYQAEELPPSKLDNVVDINTQKKTARPLTDEDTELEKIISSPENKKETAKTEQKKSPQKIKLPLLEAIPLNEKIIVPVAVIIFIITIIGVMYIFFR